MKRRALVAALAVGSAGIAVMFANQAEGDGGDRVEARAVPPTRVRVATATQSRDEHVAVLHGITRPEERTAVSFTIAGRIVARPVDVGTRVAKGDLIAKLDAEPLRNASAAAKARLAEVKARRHQTERELSRAERLLADGAGTTQQLEQAETTTEALSASRDEATAAVRESRRMLREAVLRAPFDGIVSEVIAEEDQVVGAGRPVVQLTGTERYEIALRVPASVVQQVERGQGVSVAFPGTNRLPTLGIVERISTNGSGPGGLFTIVIALGGAEGMVGGLPTRVEVPLVGAPLVSVPLAAVLDPSGSDPYAFVESEGRVHRRRIELGGLAGDRVLLRSGIAVDERVVVSGVAHLLDGDRVELER